MKISSNRVLDVFELFCHLEIVDIPFDAFALQEAINGVLDELCEDNLPANEWVQIASPEDTGLDCFTVAHYTDRWNEDEPQIFSQSFRTADEVKAALPKRVVLLLERLNEKTLIL